MKSKLLAIASILGCCSCHSGSAQDNSSGSAQRKAAPLINYRLVASYPHDTTAFTEGLLFHNGQLYESTGATNQVPNTRSLFGTVDLSTGKITPKAELDKRLYFGEGIAFLNGRVYQLTYQTRESFIYDATTFQRIGWLPRPTKEGWGMTTDGRSLILSDGTATLTWLDPETFKVERTLLVTDGNGPLSPLNELEWINGYLYANVYTTNGIVKIDPRSGTVLGRLDLGPLAQEAKLNYPGAMELNGIAYDSASGRVLVTGKKWPHLYEIAFSF